MNDNLWFTFLDVVGETELSAFAERYKNSITGQPSADDGVVAALWQRRVSSRKIQSRYREEVAFRFIVG